MHKKNAAHIPQLERADQLLNNLIKNDGFKRSVVLGLSHIGSQSAVKFRQIILS